MAEPQQNLSYSPQRLKELLDEEIQETFSIFKEVGKRIEATEEGSEERNVLLGELRQLDDHIKSLDKEFSDIDYEINVRPGLEKNIKLGEELRQTYVSPPPRGYAPYGLMPNAPDSTLDLNVPTRQEQKTAQVLQRLIKVLLGLLECLLLTLRLLLVLPLLE
jgi:hypothetical protein